MDRERISLHLFEIMSVKQLFFLFVFKVIYIFGKKNWNFFVLENYYPHFVKLFNFNLIPHSVQFQENDDANYLYL